MSATATAWNELHLAENPAVEALQSLGYTCMAPEDVDLERTSFKEPILTDRLAAALGCPPEHGSAIPAPGYRRRRNPV